MSIQKDNPFFYPAQFYNENQRCEYCEEKPCLDKCPASVAPADFIRAAAMEEPSDFKRAAALIMQMNPFGGVCGIVCPRRHCMSGCMRNELDRSIDIPSLQAYIIEKARELKVFPNFKKVKPNNKKIAIIGAGPTGLSAAAVLAQLGYSIDIFEKEKIPGGYISLIPDFRLPRQVIKRDIDFILSLGDITVHYDHPVKDAKELLGKKYSAVLGAVGLWSPFKLNVDHEDLALNAIEYLLRPEKYNMRSQEVAVVGGGAVAADTAVTARKQGAKNVQLFALETLSELLMEEQELKELINENINVQTRTRLCSILQKNGKITGIEISRVSLIEGKTFSLNNVCDLSDSKSIHTGITRVIIAIGSRSDFKRVKNEKVFYAGDYENGPTTVVEAVASGKNIAVEMDAVVSGKKKPIAAGKLKSNIIIQGYYSIPVSLETEFFGKKVETPFLLSAAPPSDGYDQMKKAYESGWTGGIMKTSFDGLPIHIPSEYMFALSAMTYANCDNVSGHPLDRVCKEVEKLVKEYPERLTMVSTGGPVTGNDEDDRKGWQNNTRKLEECGVMGIEYSLSCPQGGDGTEGDIVSQNASLTAKIIDWIMEAGDANIPKLFKLTGAVTSIEAIVLAIKEVLAGYPDKKAGITLANTFPSLAFRLLDKKEW
ncbi:MAG: FAD-dependent oxidoreductase, partial [Spirochaetes bacterium]|nr:FAD-dependent oxidoreductase [Spirochaetota bacterium]